MVFYQRVSRVYHTIRQYRLPTNFKFHFILVYIVSRVFRNVIAASQVIYRNRSCVEEWPQITTFLNVGHKIFLMYAYHGTACIQACYRYAIVVCIGLSTFVVNDRYTGTIDISADFWPSPEVSQNYRYSR